MLFVVNSSIHTNKNFINYSANLKILLVFDLLLLHKNLVVRNGLGDLAFELIDLIYESVLQDISFFIALLRSVSFRL